ncbi:MAG: T9SS type A sorting domain-containing protein [Flavobacteriaceae bacterium]|nr:T9SS type A sorting domain-containing protein [Flavobacteriaceae bacterium]
MKKTLLLTVVLFVITTMNAQYVVEDHDGNEIIDGMVVEFSDYGIPNGSLEYYITNNDSNEIYMRIEFVDAINATGAGFELCFGQCYIDLIVGQTVPAAPGFVTIASGGTTPEGNHFANTIEGTEIQDYIFRFYETDSEGNDIGNSLSFTYRYNPILGINDFNELDITVASTVILNNMQVNAVEELNMEIYSLQGKLVNSQKIDIGQQLISMSNLSSQMYIVKFSNDEGVSKTIKVVKK